jgi:hypothetical protein
MATKLVRNMRPQPMYCNLLGGRTLKIRARGVAEVEEADLNCPDLLFHRSRGHIVIVDKPETSRAPSR